MSQTDTPILTLDEAAALLKMTPRWLQRSTCPRIRTGKYARYHRDAVLAWYLAQNEQAA